MAQALSDDLRYRVLKASAAGMSARQAAARFGVGISTAIRWIARAKEGEPTARPQGWRRPSALDAHEAFVVGLIEDRKDVTLDEMVELLSVNAGVNSGQRAEQNQATCGARMRPPGGRSPSGGLMRARRF